MTAIKQTKFKLMGDNILDEAESYTGPRTCPACGFQFPFFVFVSRLVMKYGSTKWTCPKCQNPIKYNLYKTNLRWLIGFFGIVLLFLGLQTIAGFHLQFKYFLIPCLFVAILPLHFGEFEKDKD